MESRSQLVLLVIFYSLVEQLGNIIAIVNVDVAQNTFKTTGLDVANDTNVNVKNVIVHTRHINIADVKNDFFIVYNLKG